LEFADVEKVIETTPKSHEAHSRIPLKPLKKKCLRRLNKWTKVRHLNVFGLQYPIEREERLVRYGK